jgi:hypothetical protein
MLTKKFKDWAINEEIDYSAYYEIEGAFSEIPMIKKWEDYRNQRNHQLSFNKGISAISLTRGYKKDNNPKSMRINFNLPREFIIKVRDLEKNTECHIIPDLIDDRIVINFLFDERLRYYTNDNDVKRKFSDIGKNIEVDVSYNTIHMGDLKNIFTRTIELIIDAIKDANYIFNADIRRFPNLKKIMAEQVDETYQSLVSDLVDGNLDAIANEYKFDDDTVMVMIARAMEEDPSLESAVNDFSDEAKDLWFSNMGGKDLKITSGLSKQIKALKRVKNSLKFI